MKTVRIKFPKLIVVRDYHEFNDIKNMLNSLCDTPMKVKELSTESGIGKKLSEKYNSMYIIYIGVIYCGKMPTDNEIENLEFCNLR